MSVVNEFKAKQVVYGSDPKQVYLLDESGNRSVFAFDIYCHARPMATKFNFFFNVSAGKMLIIYEDRTRESKYECGLLRFWITKDEPVPSCAWLQNTDQLMKLISDQFKEQFAAYTIDQIINSSDSESV